MKRGWNFGKAPSLSQTQVSSFSHFALFGYHFFCLCVPYYRSRNWYELISSWLCLSMARTFVCSCRLLASVLDRNRCPRIPILLTHDVLPQPWSKVRPNLPVNSNCTHQLEHVQHPELTIASNPCRHFEISIQLTIVYLLIYYLFLDRWFWCCLFYYHLFVNVSLKYWPVKSFIYRETC